MAMFSKVIPISLPRFPSGPRTKTLINIFLIILFICLAVVIIAPFMAQAQFDAAERLVAGYMWKDAEKRMGEAIKIDPYNSRYPARLGEFLFSQSGYKDNPIPLLKTAEEYYSRASGLTPRYAEYFTKQGEINLAIFLEGPSNTELIRRAFANFKKRLRTIRTASMPPTRPGIRACLSGNT